MEGLKRKWAQNTEDAPKEGKSDFAHRQKLGIKAQAEEMSRSARQVCRWEAGPLEKVALRNRFRMKVPLKEEKFKECWQ